MQNGHLVTQDKTNPIRTQTNPIKANLQNAQINVTTFQAEVYENKSNWALFENKPNTKPIKLVDAPVAGRSPRHPRRTAYYGEVFTA